MKQMNKYKQYKHEYDLKNNKQEIVVFRTKVWVKTKITEIGFIKNNRACHILTYGEA